MGSETIATEIVLPVIYALVEAFKFWYKSKKEKSKAEEIREIKEALKS